jgi:hypothetical protein
VDCGYIPLTFILAFASNASALHFVITKGSTPPIQMIPSPIKNLSKPKEEEKTQSDTVDPAAATLPNHYQPPLISLPASFPCKTGAHC